MADLPPFIRAVDGGCALEVQVIPKSSRNAVVGEHHGRLKIALTAPPVEGQANEALLKFLAKLLGISKSNLEVARGEKSKQKTIHIKSTTAEEIQKRLSPP